MEGTLPSGKSHSDAIYRIQLIPPRNCRDQRCNYSMVLHSNQHKPCHLQENLHQQSTPQPNTGVIPQSELSKGEMDPWVCYQWESSIISQLNQQSCVLRISIRNLNHRTMIRKRHSPTWSYSRCIMQHGDPHFIEQYNLRTNISLTQPLLC